VTLQTHLGGEAEQAQTQVGRNSVSLTDITGNQTNLHKSISSARSTTSSTGCR
jgi:hypothetical protein